MEFSEKLFEESATICFLLAIIHTALIRKIHHLAHRPTLGPKLGLLLKLLSEVELVFAIWAMTFLGFTVITGHGHTVGQYLWSVGLTEPLFIFAIMAVCSARPIRDFGAFFIQAFSRLLPVHPTVSFYFSCLTLGPLLGALITEPAAMTVVSMILLERYFQKSSSELFKYVTLGLLFVNISIGGVLTPYAAAPVLVVAKTWNWNLWFVFSQFGWKAAIAVILSTSIATFAFRKELVSLGALSGESKPLQFKKSTAVFLGFLFLIVLQSSEPRIFMPVFGLFLLTVRFAKDFYTEIALRESAKVGFFLWGLFILGEPQMWWVQPLLLSFTPGSLFLGGIALTSITDNAALTYLGSQVSQLSDFSKYALTAGAITGGGLTVIANAPNPIGYAVLNSTFGKDGISPMGLFLAAIPPTLMAALCFWFL